MSEVSSPHGFEPTKLSEREQSVFDLAIDGLTDYQIACRLEIRPSTVNSYWVRIRGKIGQHSRTELVSLALKARAEQQLSEIRTRSAELERAVEEHANDSRDYESAATFAAAFEAMPEAMLILGSEGEILFANEACTALLKVSSTEIAGSLLETHVPNRQQLPLQTHLDDCRSRVVSRKLGINEVLYLQRADGSQIRAILLIGSRSTSRGMITVCLVRPFMEEVEMMRRQASTFASTLL